MTAPAAARTAPPRASRAVHPVTKYARDVIAGRIVAGKLVQLACERHLRDLKGGSKRGLAFDEEAANRVLQFFSFLKQRKGEWANETIELQPWQVFRVGSVFGWKRWDQDSRTWIRRFRTSWNEVARKNGKTTEAAGIGNYLAFFDGEPGAEVYCAATKRDQAKVCWSEAKWQVDHLPAVLKRGVTLLVANMHSVATASKFEPLGADEDSGDSINPHALLLDEMHAWKSRDYLEKMSTAQGARRQPLKWIITTAGAQGESLYAEQHDYAVKVLEGVIEDDSFFAYIACIDDPEKWQDEREWAKANPNLGVSVKLRYLQEQCAKAREIPAQESSYKRYHCNIRTTNEARFIASEVWNAQKPRTPIDQLAGRRCYLGLDLASTMDIASAALWFPDDDGNGGDVHMFRWVPEESMRKRSQNDRVPYDAWVAAGLIEATPGPVIDYDAIESKVKELAKNYALSSVGVDPWNAQQVSKHLADEGLTVVDVHQNMTRLAAPTKELMRLLQSQGLRHGGDPVLRWMAGNAVTRSDSSGNIRLDKQRSREKIDDLAALVNALSEALAGKPKEKRGISLYVPGEEPPEGAGS